MKIKVVKQTDKKIKDFEKKEWDLADEEHYGRRTDWDSKHVMLVAYEGNEVVGTLKLRIKLGVAEIKTLLVSSEKRRQGIGSTLLQKVETIAKEHHVHKLFLITGKGWASENFYQKHGFIATGSLLKHYMKHDFIEYTRYI